MGAGLSNLNNKPLDDCTSEDLSGAIDILAKEVPAYKDYVEVCKNQGVDGEALAGSLEAGDLEEILEECGVGRKLHRRKFITVLQKIPRRSVNTGTQTDITIPFDESNGTITPPPPAAAAAATANNVNTNGRILNHVENGIINNNNNNANANQPPQREPHNGTVSWRERKMIKEEADQFALDLIEKCISTDKEFPKGTEAYKIYGKERGHDIKPNKNFNYKLRPPFDPIGPVQKLIIGDKAFIDFYNKQIEDRKKSKQKSLSVQTGQGTTNSTPTTASEQDATNSTPTTASEQEDSTNSTPTAASEQDATNNSTPTTASEQDATNNSTPMTTTTRINNDIDEPNSNSKNSGTGTNNNSTAVGELVGGVVGPAVGGLVAPGVGGDVGEDVGGAVGPAVGGLVAPTVGGDVGEVVGRVVGPAVGGLVVPEVGGENQDTTNSTPTPSTRINDIEPNSKNSGVTNNKNSGTNNNSTVPEGDKTQSNNNKSNNKNKNPGTNNTSTTAPTLSSSPRYFPSTADQKCMVYYSQDKDDKLSSLVTDFCSPKKDSKKGFVCKLTNKAIRWVGRQTRPTDYGYNQSDYKGEADVHLHHRAWFYSNQRAVEKGITGKKAKMHVLDDDYSGQELSKANNLDLSNQEENPLLTYFDALGFDRPGGGNFHRATDMLKSKSTCYPGHHDKAFFEYVIFVPTHGTFWTAVALLKELDELPDASSNEEFESWRSNRPVQEKHLVDDWISTFKTAAANDLRFQNKDFEVYYFKCEPGNWIAFPARYLFHSTFTPKRERDEYTCTCTPDCTAEQECKECKSVRELLVLHPLSRCNGLDESKDPSPKQSNGNTKRKKAPTSNPQRKKSARTKK